MPQKESNRKGEMPQNKNLTLLCFPLCLKEGEEIKQDGFNNAREKSAYKGNQ